MQGEQDDLAASGLEIAIVGMAGRFPGAADVDAFWRNLRDGVESVRHYSTAQLRALGVPESVLADPAYVKSGVVFEGVDLFDADLFGYTPRDAEQLDPQHRLFLECAWAALEHAGYDPLSCRGRVGVVAGSGANVYLMRHLLPHQTLEQGGNIAELLGLLSGNMADALCTRVAYKLDLRGPAVTVQTACSTSLMAVHTACQTLLGHECDMALAGGVSLNLLQNGGYLHQAGAIFSRDGHCRAFDADATGTLLGSGAGIVVLKRLDDAVREGDTIHAVIRGSAANNDGADKVGFTAPSVGGQAAVIRAAHANAGVAAATIGYVEAHGTGTALGDPIEIAALTEAFAADPERAHICAVGSVKTNIGHLDAAAGVAGLIKAVLMLRHRTLPPSLHFERANPQIDFSRGPFQVNTVGRPWPVTGMPRRAGVSAFGIGGTNVHVVLEEAPLATPVMDVASWQVLPLSARDPSLLNRMGRELAAHLQDAQPCPALADVAQTLQVGRRAFAHRCAIVVDNAAMAAEHLRVVGTSLNPATRVAEPALVAFLFPGGGVQHANMGLALYRSEPVFRAEVDRCCELLRAESNIDLRSLLYPAPGAEAAADEALARMDHAQPALFVIGYALARLWMARGVRPAAMLGHSLGEYVAACLAGVFALEDALRIVALRGRLLHSVAGGAMTTVPLSAHEIEPFLHAGCDLAAINSEQSCVLSGPLQAIEAAEQELRARAIAPRRLHIAVASHSAMTEPVLDELESAIAAVPRNAPQLPFISSVSGKPITAEEAASPAYWARHLRCTVRFADGLGELLNAGMALLEVGPGEALCALARQHPHSAAAAGIWASQAHPQQQERNPQQMAQACAGLWCAGVAIDWSACYPQRQRRRVPLPTLIFQRKSYWVDAPAKPGAPSVAMESDDRALYTPLWRQSAMANGTGAQAVAGATSALVLGAESVLAGCLIERLQACGTRVVRVEAGTAYRCLGSDHYAVRPAEYDDYAALLADAEAGTKSISAIYCLWSVDAATAMSTQGDAALQRGFFSVLALVQALEQNASVSRLLLVAASAAEDISGEEPLCAEKATLFPLCKVVGQECPRIDCRFVDIVAPASPAAATLLADQLIAESVAPRAHDTAVAYRGSERWVKSYVPLRLQPTSGSRLRQRGVYIITGGLGGVGLALAGHLARHWQARLVLLGRTAAPARAHWETLAGDADQPDSVRQLLRQLLALEDAGAEVSTVAADVVDTAQMQAAIAHARDRFGAVHGVIHAAGSNGTGMLGKKTSAEVARVFAPKLTGTRVLLETLGSEPLDFVLLCSSVASVTGGLGKGDYAAANAYLDATAAIAARTHSYPVIAVGWDAWRDLGMAAGMDIPVGIGWDGVEGARVFERILDGATVSQVIVSTTDLESRLGDIDSGMLDILAAPSAAFATRRSHPRPPLSTEYVAPSGDLEETLATLWTETLGIAPVGLHDNLFELGGDSLLAIQLLAKVRKSFGVDLHPANFFKAPTLDSLAGLVEIQMIEEIERSASAAGASAPTLDSCEN